MIHIQICLLCVQAGVQIPDAYRPMMRIDIVVPEGFLPRLMLDLLSYAPTHNNDDDVKIIKTRYP